MTAPKSGGEALKKSSESTGTDIIDAELADQLGELIEHIETVPWARVPGLSATTAATFNRCLIEARSQLLLPRVITDGGCPEIEATVQFNGTGEYAEGVGFDIEHVEMDGGETQVVRVTADLYDMAAEVDFLIDDADEFLVHFRDEIVRAKRARLEWKTNTDPETGIAGEEL